MEFTDAVRSRTMTRHFLSDPVDETTLDQLFSLSLRSPSAGSSQGVELLVLTKEVARANFWETISEPDWRQDERRSRGLTQAPVIVIPCASPDTYIERYSRSDKTSSTLAGLAPRSWPVPYWSVDAAFAAMTLLLSVSDVGLGALFFHLQGREEQFLRAFNVPEEMIAIGAIAIGVPESTPPEKRSLARRRSSKERVHHERW